MKKNGIEPTQCAQILANMKRDDFQHIEADAFLIDFLQTKFKLKEMKKAFTNWQNKLNGRAWNTLYIENHDHPRIISRYGNEKYRVQSGKMLANMYMLQQGTPFVYQV